MNKKIIAIAIASAMAAPAAMADLKISGSFYGEILSMNDGAVASTMTFDPITGLATDNGLAETGTPKSAMTFADGGNNAISFTATSGNVYGKMGLNVGPAASGADFQPKYRDFFIGYDLGNGSSVQFGTMNGANKNLEKDAYIATFLQTRNTFAEATTNKKYGSSSFISNVIQFKAKVGNGTLIAQYNPNSDVNDTYNADEGHTGVSYAAKSGGVNWYVGYNNGAGSDADTTDDTNMKVGASMKFGTIKANLDYSSADDGTSDWSAISIGATMDMGNGMSANVNYGMMDTGGANDPTSMRLAVTKSLAKDAVIYGGYTSHDYDVPGMKSADIFGLGMGIKF